jgi:hypothetical protein
VERAEQDAYLRVREISEREAVMDDQVKPQDASLRNSAKVASEEQVPEQALDLAGDGFCYWNDKKYSDGGTVCDNHQRFKCWGGHWVDIGNC